MRWYTDGAGWNGTISRYAIANDDREFPIKVFHSEFTNNEMEYMALIDALERASEGDAVVADSLLVVNQVNGEWKVKKKHLVPYHAKAQGLARRKGITLSWIDRSKNKAGRMLESTI